MGWPQITVIVLASAGVAINLVKHGEQRGRYNVGYAMVAVGIEMALLYAGGFFS